MRQFRSARASISCRHQRFALAASICGSGFGTAVALWAADAGGRTCDRYDAMSYGMYISAEGANAQAQRLEVIANNMANVDTAGFKQDVPTFQARFAEAIQQGTGPSGQQVDQRRRRRREDDRHADRLFGRRLQADRQRPGLRDQRQGLLPIKGHDGQDQLHASRQLRAG